MSEEIELFEFEYKKSKQITIKQIQDYLNGDAPLKDAFDIGNILYVFPQGYESPVPFEIVHISEETRSIYFMSVEILEIAKFGKIGAWLQDFKSRLPLELVDYLKPVEHISPLGISQKKISIPSLLNMCISSKFCIGKDDIPFYKFRTQVSRCKRYNGNTASYWTLTPDAIEFGRLFTITYAGNYRLELDAMKERYGICPIFKLSKDK